jgi:hypothetical protein
MEFTGAGADSAIYAESEATTLREGTSRAKSGCYHKPWQGVHMDAFSALPYNASGVKASG